MSDQSSGGQADRISAEIAALASLGIRGLKSRGRAWYDTDPPARISRELLTSAIAYRLQEREFGGLAPATRRLLEGSPPTAPLAGWLLPEPCSFASGGVRRIRSRCTTMGSSIGANAMVRCPRSRG